MDKYIGPDGEIMEEKIKEIGQVAESFKAENSNLGILSLTEDPLSVLMWSHYGDKHKGVCIGFSRVEGADLADDDACIPITYSDIYPAPRFSQIYSVDASLTKDILCTKARDWAYEKEWRMMVKHGCNYVRTPGQISRVILGCRFPDEEISKFAEICNQINVQLFRAYQIPNRFALDLKVI